MSDGTEEAFVENVFDSSDAGNDTAPEGALESWDDVDAYEAPAEQAQEEVSEELDSEIKIETPDNGEEPVEETKDEDSEEDSEESPEDKVEGEEAEDEGEETPLEIPEQLTELGLVANEGQIGKMVKIDGEDTFVPLSDLGNDFSGQKALDRRFTEFDQKEKQWKAEIDEVESYVDTFAGKMKEGDAMGAMSFLGEFSGLAPYQIKRQLIEQLSPEIERLASMSGPELQAEYAKEENEYLKQTLETERDAIDQKQAQGELQREIDSVRQTRGIEDSEWDQAIAYLQEHEQELRAQDPNLVMDANFVGDFVMDQRAYGKAESALESASVSLSDEGSQEILSYLHDTAYRNPDFTQEDLVELVNAAKKSAVESKVSESLGNRVKKHDSKPKPKGEQNNQELTPEEDDYLQDVWG